LELAKIFRDCVDEQFWSEPSTKFIFLPTRPITQKGVNEIYKFFRHVKRLNVAVVYQDENSAEESSVKIMAFDLIRKQLFTLIPTTNVDEVFPDKLQNMDRYNYKIVGSDQKPRLFRKNGKFYGFDVFFMEIVTKQQNASFSIENLDLKNQIGKEKLFKNLLSGNVDLSLNTINTLGTDKILEKINTYDINGYCALIPIPPRESFLKYLLVPYDTASWILMVISLIGLAIVWKVFRNQRDSRGLSSVGRVIFRVIAGFLGQAFSFVTTRWFHLMVMQVFIFMVLILGNAYQSILISLMTVSRNGTRISTVNEMVNGDYNFLSDPFFFVMLEDHQPDNGIFKRMDAYTDDDFNYKVKAENKTVLILRCDEVHELFFTDNNVFEKGNPSDYYYILPEKVHNFYEKIMVSRFSPFTDRLKEFSLRIFESGIKQHWTTLLHKLTDEINLQQISIMKEEFLLKMGDFKYVFYIWAIGLSVASIAFVAELLCYKYRARIRRTWIGKLMRKWSGTERRIQREMMMVRRRARVVIEPFEEFEMIQC
jgi:Ligand-gated ion channel